MSSNDTVIYLQHLNFVISFYVLPVLFAFGIPGNLLCMAVFYTKAKENNGFIYQLINTFNDFLILISNLFYCSFYYWFLPTDIGGYKSYAWVWFYVYFCDMMVNVVFNVSPFLMLNTCIERNRAIFTPFAFRQREKRILGAVMVVQYLIMIVNNGFDVSMESIKICGNTTEVYYCPTPNRNVGYNMQQFVAYYNLVIISSTAVCLVFIFFFNITFICQYVKMQHWRQKMFHQKNQSCTSNEQVLAVTLIAQSVIISLPQACIIPMSFFNSTVIFNNCYNNCGSMTNQILLFFGNFFSIAAPASNFFVYCAISRDFKHLAFNLCRTWFNRWKEKLKAIATCYCRSNAKAQSLQK